MNNFTLDFLLNEKKADNRIVKAAETLLDALKYEASGADGGLLHSCIVLAENHIKNVCNISEIPDGLVPLAARRVVGEFLRMKNGMGTLNIEALDLSGAVTQIKEGDVSVSFGSGSSDLDKFNALLKSLLNDGEGELVCYRKLKW